MSKENEKLNKLFESMTIECETLKETNQDQAEAFKKL